MLYNNDTPLLASELSSFAWAIYGFNSGHFVSSLLASSVASEVVLAVDTRLSGQALFKEFTNCPVILDSAIKLLERINLSTATTTIHGYLIHAHRFLHHDTQHWFWKTQSQLIKALQTKRRLQVFVAHLHIDCNEMYVEVFVRSVTRSGGVISSHHVYYPNFGDSVADEATFLIGNQRTTTAKPSAIMLPTPPAISSKCLADHIYLPFNQLNMCVCQLERALTS